MKTAASLHSVRQKELAKMARDRGIPGWHAMRKEELIEALSQLLPKRRLSKSGPARQLASESCQRKKPASTKENSGKHPVSAARRRIRQARQEHLGRRDLATGTAASEDRILLMVRDAYWLQAVWELCPRSIERAQAALAERWHSAQPVLRLCEVVSQSSSQVETVLREILIHGAASMWFIDVDRSSTSFRVEIGYATDHERFYALARSNLVTTHAASSVEASDASLSDIAENSERIFAMSGAGEQPTGRNELRKWMEGRLQRPLGSPMETRYGNGAHAVLKQGPTLTLTLDADMVVYGLADPSAYVTIGGEPVKLQADGTFTARLKLPDRRQVIPVIASSRDGGEERTIVLAVERNTKIMEPRIRESGF